MASNQQEISSEPRSAHPSVASSTNRSTQYMKSTSQRSSEIEDPESGSGPHFHSSYRNLSHRLVAKFLYEAMSTGRLGSGPREKEDAEQSILSRFFESFPWKMTILQLIWSAIVTIVAYFIDRDSSSGITTLSTEFWNTRISLASSVVSGVGWALFVLLGFFIQESATGYKDAQLLWGNIASLMRQTVRLLRQNYSEGDWHDGDMDRIAAHLVAYPIALKMTLREEREREQLSKILSPKDLDDILTAPSMFLHCSKVVRSYFSSIQGDQTWGFKPTAVKSPAGHGAAYFYTDLVDQIDKQARIAERIKNYESAAGYTSHLRIFLYIWLLFLPVSIIKTSGWFTVIWSLMITYGIGMLFRIAESLNQPYGFGLGNIKLNRLSAEAAIVTLNFYSRAKIELKDVIKDTQEPSLWLSKSQGHKCEVPQRRDRSIFCHILDSFLSFRIEKNIVTPLSIFVAWVIFISLLAWGLRIRSLESSFDITRCSSMRWWCIYIPLDSSTTSYFGLGISVLLGFWLNDAYGRYRRGIDIWQVTLRRSLEHIACLFCITFKKGSWHLGDRERIISHVAALPYAVKLKLRRNRDAEELREVLSRRDYQALVESDDYVDHCLAVIRGYKDSADMLHPIFKSAVNPMRGSRYNFDYALWEFECAVEECDAMQKCPFPYAFTLHLKLYSAVWLAVIPVAVVEFYGFLSLLFLIPFAYLILRLISMGAELADPFGTDEHDIPLDEFCKEIRMSLYDIFRKAEVGPKCLLKDTGYARENFHPKFWTLDADPEEGKESHTVKKSFGKILDSFPSVNLRAMVAVFLWTGIAVTLSFLTRNAFNDLQQLKCDAWCSPIDVDGEKLLEIGFALFLILSFRASDAVRRYERGASLLKSLSGSCRELAVEICKLFVDGAWHSGDKERLVAHIVQLPLSLRDELLQVDRAIEEEGEGVLSSEDRLALESSIDPVDHCLFTLESYLILHDTQDFEYRELKKNIQGTVTAGYETIKSCFQLRKVVSEVRVIKRFLVVQSYTNNQRLFTGFWLALLPLAMTSRSGWWTLLWAPLVSYGVLGMEAVATELADPLGHDAIYIPVDVMAKSGAARVIDAVNSIRWGRHYHITKPEIVPDAQRGVDLYGSTHRDLYSFPYFSRDSVDANSLGKKRIPSFERPREEMKKKTLFTHLTHSIPWWTLLGIAAWTTIAVIISYLSRNIQAARNLDLATSGFRWWISRKEIDPLVGSYVSFAGFALLGFFANAAFSRYSWAGNIWGDDLRARCHSLTLLVLTYAPAGSWHEGDHERIIGHIASLPIVLKMQARGDRNLIELKGLLSEGDLGRLHCANDMARHCLDVLRSYFLTAIEFPEELKKPVRSSSQLFAFIWFRIKELDDVIGASQFLCDVGIARGFKILLRTLLGIFFTVLPFILAESTGWFAILWASIIAYGVLGLYVVAEELEHPFGTDLNDIDLDKIAAEIVDDVLFVQKNYQKGTDMLVVPGVKDSGSIWKKDRALGQEADSEIDLVPVSGMYNSRTNYLRNLINRLPEQGKAVRLAANSVSWWMLPLAVFWSAIAIAIAKAVSHQFPFAGTAQTDCFPGFCTRIAVVKSVKEYIGYALFLLLGFRLHDSHSRYATAIRLWEDGIKSTTEMIANRIFEGHKPGTWHQGDMERIAAHLAAFSVVTISRLRGEAFQAELLRGFMNEDDVERISKPVEKSDYCSDVIRGYLMKGDELQMTGKSYSLGVNEHWYATYLVDLLPKQAAELDSLVRNPLPFGYIQHIRIFLVIWLGLLPLALVEQEGWFSILWTLFIAYGVIGVERWSGELANPFGKDLSDLPMKKLQQEAFSAVHYNLNLYRDGSNATIKKDRQGFPL